MLIREKACLPTTTHHHHPSHVVSCSGFAEVFFTKDLAQKKAPVVAIKILLNQSERY